VINELLTQAGCRAIDASGVTTFAELPVLPTLRAPREVADPATTPLVSVIVPAFRAAGTIAHALGSLQAQTYTHLQIIVVDDAGGDDTADVVRHLARDDTRLSLVRQPVNRGAYAARNAGLERATGAFVTVHDADDWAHPERIDRQVRHLLAHPDVVANATHLVRLNQGLHLRPHGRHPYKLVGKNTASLMVRRQIFSVVGPWDARVRGGGDFEFVKRLEARFGSPAIAHLVRRAPLTLSLRHDASLTSAPGTGMASLWHVYGARRQYLDAFTAWHGSDRFASDLPWRVDAARPFPAPLALTGQPGGSFVDVVVRGDLSLGASGVADAVGQVVRAAGAGRSLALWHEPHDIEGLWRALDPAIVRLLADQRARLLSAGEQLRCQNLITVGRPSVLGSVDGAPQVTAVPW
jgi:glycosyltransferase involved in cell wall biosynthesis